MIFTGFDKGMMQMRKVAVIRGLLVCFLIVFMSQSPGWCDSDDGYFLSMEQKGQLISSGRIRDKNGVWYDIWICPGYVPPYRYAKKYFYKTGWDFGEYAHAEKYKDLARHSKDAYRWAFDDCIHKFIIKGIPNAWETHLQTAGHRTEKRVFGWWFAYPWAVMESTVESVARVPIGLTGTAVGTVWGTAAVPAYYMTNSSAKGIWHFSAQTVAVPAVSMTWNTIISPPMSLFGQKPSLSRVDGFWVKTLTHRQVSDMEASDLQAPTTRDDIVALEQWGITLETTLDPYAKEYARAADEAREAIRKIYAERGRKQKLIAEKESERVDELKKEPGTQQMLKPLRGRGFTASRVNKSRSEIKTILQENGVTDQKRINRIIHLLLKYPPSTAIRDGFTRSKTDPVRRSVDIIKNVQIPDKSSSEK